MLTDDEINECFESVMFDPNSDPSREAIGRAIIAAHTAKLLAGVEMPEPDAHFHLHQYGEDMLLREQVSPEYKDEEGVFPLFTADQLQQYAAAAAAQARMKALSEAMLAVNSGVLGHGECAAAIESLKGKP